MPRIRLESISVARYLAIALLLFFTASSISAVDLIDLGTRRELFVDKLLIDTMQNARLELHAPQEREIVLRFEKPWEGRYSGYFTVLQDASKLRLYYRGLSIARHSLDTEVTCYAESVDGVSWSKPNLGLFEVQGTRKNNVILARHRACHNFSPFIDSNPACPPTDRYKALGGTGAPGLVALVSSDGIRWRDVRKAPVITKGAFDSQNVAFWSTNEKKYVCYFRVFRRGVRWIARSTSDDFVNWSEPIDMDFEDGPVQHLYTNQTLAYPRAPHIYLGFPTRFMPGRRALSRERAETIGTSVEKWDFRNDCADIMLTSTRGGNALKRTFLEAYIRPGRDPRNWTSRANYAAYGLVSRGDEDLVIFVNHNVGFPTTHLRRYSLRPDGFASISGDYSGGTVVTHPLRFDGSHLEINYSTSAAGGLRIELQDKDGKAFPGFDLRSCDEIIGDEITRVVAWKGKSDIASLVGRAVRIKFELRDADVFSLRFSTDK